MRVYNPGNRRSGLAGDKPRGYSGWRGHWAGRTSARDLVRARSSTPARGGRTGGIQPAPNGDDRLQTTPIANFRGPSPPMGDLGLPRRPRPSSLSVTREERLGFAASSLARSVDAPKNKPTRPGRRRVLRHAGLARCGRNHGLRGDLSASHASCMNAPAPPSPLPIHWKRTHAELRPSRTKWPSPIATGASDPRRRSFPALTRLERSDKDRTISFMQSMPFLLERSLPCIEF